MKNTPKNNRLKKSLDFLGGIPDVIMRNIPDVTRKTNPLGYDEYLSLLKFYAPDNWAGKSFLYIPKSVPEHQESFAGPIAGGAKNVFTYPSRYKARNPAMADELDGFKENSTGYIYMWQHEKGGARPLILCLHGFMMGTPQQAVRMFKFRKLYEMGMDVALFVQPHHWKRSPKPFVQHLLNPENVPLTIESFGQNIHDLHSAVLLLKSAGYDRIGVIGASLGGFTAALYSSFNAPVDFIFMVVPAITFDFFLDPRNAKFSFRVDSKIKSATTKALDLISPLSHKPVFDVEKISVVIHGGDRLAKAEVAREWIKKWNISHSVEVAGGHWLYLDREVRGNTWYDWLQKMDYIKIR